VESLQAGVCSDGPQDTIELALRQAERESEGSQILMAAIFLEALRFGEDKEGDCLLLASR
jgi:hypothetical protein